MFKSLNPILNHEGLRVGDLVKLTGVQMPGGDGKIVKIKLERDSGEMAFDVQIRNGYDYDNLENWYPIFRNELVKA